MEKSIILKKLVKTNLKWIIVEQKGKVHKNWVKIYISAIQVNWINNMGITVASNLLTEFTRVAQKL